MKGYSLGALQMSKAQNSLYLGSFLKKKKSDPNIWNQISFWLFKSKSINWLKFSRLSRWKNSKDNPCTSSNNKGCKDNTLINFSWKSHISTTKRRIYEIYNSITQQESYKSSNKSDHNWLNQELKCNITIQSTDRFSNSDFPSSFCYRYDHNIHHSNSSNQKGDCTHSQ